jgi:hypothetical protein
MAIHFELIEGQTFIDRPENCAELWLHRHDGGVIPGGYEACAVAGLYAEWRGELDAPFLVADVMEKELWKLPWRVRRLGYVDERTAVYGRML